MMDPMPLPPPTYRPSPQLSAMSPDPPIDPSLAIDPAILGQACDPQQSGSSRDTSPRPSPTSASQFQFEQGPQGDPFAPQLNDAFFHPRLPTPPRPLKRKRKTRPVARRDEECSFCQGDDSRNKAGEPEEMVSCVACGRSGHPSCLDIQGIADILRSYPWHCIECKICEVCDKKGNGNRMLFCDACDRGWHMDCLDPPLDSTPDGSWICPLCSCGPLPPQENVCLPPFPPHSVSASPAPSVASSSRSPPQQFDQKSRMRPTAKVKRKAHDDLEVDVDESPRIRHKTEPDVRMGNKGRGKMKGKGLSDVKGKGKARASQPLEAPIPTLRLAPNKLRVPKRSRSRSAEPPTPVLRKVRLVVRKPRVVPDEDEEEAEDNGSPSHIFEGVLKPEECNTNNTRVLDSDKSLFNRSRTRAEMKLGPPVAPPPLPSVLPTPGPATPSTPGPSAGLSTASGLLHSLRPRHSVKQAHTSTTTDTPPGTPNASGPVNGVPPPPRIRTIRFGEYDVDTWYDAPFPEEYASVSDGKLWMCEFCLKYMKSRFQSTRHRMKCKVRHPPGDEIYRDGTISVFEVDGRKNKIYCQNLCLLSKMFLDHKSLFYDVEPFLFYVMTEVDRLGARFVGYFSKEKRSPKNYNVSCIMTIPVRQRKGWGNILIDFSYLLSKKEERVGSPERPLSALGALAYKQYWAHTIKLFLHTASEPVRLEDISRATSMTLEDIYNTLRDLNFITAKERTPAPPPRPPPGTPIKYLRGRKNGPGITRRGLTRTSTKDDSKAPLVIPTEYTVHWDQKELDAYVTAWRAKEYVTVQPRCLKWSPFLLSRAQKSETVDGAEAETNGVREAAGVAPTEQDRWSASSTKVTQTALLDLGVSTPKLSGEHSLMESAHVIEVQPPRLSVDNDDSKSLIDRPTSHDASQVAEDRAFAAELARTSESPRRLRSSTGSKSRREASIEEPRSTPTSEPTRLRSLRSRSSVNGKPTRNTEEKVMADPETAQDSALAAILAREGTRQTRSMSNRIDSQMTSTPRTSPRKRQRVESSPSVESDADCSLSELTRGSSTSPSPSPPPPRRVSRALNGRWKSQQRNGTNSVAPKTNMLTRSAHMDIQPLTLRLSSRTNGSINNPPLDHSAAKGIPAIEEVQRARTRSMRRAKTEPVHDDNADVESKQTDREHCLRDKGEARENRDEEGKGDAGNGFPTPLNKFSASVHGNGLDGLAPGLCDEDALGEEDAEGEEDPNPSDIDR